MDDDHGLHAKKNKKKKGKIISRLANKGNFSDFRNKSFVPNAARVAKKQSHQQGGVSEQKTVDSDDDFDRNDSKFQSLIKNSDDDSEVSDSDNESADSESSDDHKSVGSQDETSN